MRYAAQRLGEHGATAVIEPINGGRDLIRGGEAYTRYGMAGFFLNHVRDALRIMSGGTPAKHQQPHEYVKVQLK